MTQFVLFVLVMTIAGLVICRVAYSQWWRGTPSSENKVVDIHSIPDSLLTPEQKKQKNEEIDYYLLKVSKAKRDIEELSAALKQAQYMLGEGYFSWKRDRDEYEQKVEIAKRQLNSLLSKHPDWLEEQ